METAVWAGFVAFGFIVLVVDGVDVVALGVVVVVVLGVVAVCAIALTLNSATKAAVVNIVAILMGASSAD
ncbi:hypothetical protein thsrh120_21570 [Rhizobium sp. No.120]